MSGDNQYVSKRSHVLSKQLPKMSYGSKPTDGGNLILSAHEAEDVLTRHPELSNVVKLFIGADEFIKGTERFCLWITEENHHEVAKIPEIEERLTKVARMRTASTKIPTKELASIPWRFAEVRYKPTDSITIPSHTSDQRDYIPIGYLDANAVISNASFAVYDAEPWLFALLTSKMHMAWVRAVGGRLGTGIRYGNTLVYNTFPVPELSASSKEELTKRALRVLDVREYHCEKTLAELYDPDLMPRNLREAHEKIDEAVDRLYKSTPFASDEERLAVLFAKYQQMIEAEGK
ncbi:type IIL restriction-modification enzyme MmeI [Actinotignum sp. GS-2025a]|uniref:type IIL restriction-modification enzyme MmeI n=1 Tax=Actinotignum sp. GS-2025a TaxID=3427274 RepID=UPI003F45740E